MSDKNIVISYRENEDHAKFVPLMEDVIKNTLKDVSVTVLKSPALTPEATIKENIASLYPTLDDWSIYLSDYTSKIPYELARQFPEKQNIKHKSLEDIYRNTIWLDRAKITDYEVVKKINDIDELKEIASNDIKTIATKVATSINKLPEIKKVELVVSNVTCHIPSIGRFERIIETDEDVRKKWEVEYGSMLCEKLKELCPEKEIVLNYTIDSQWDSLNADKITYLKEIDNESVCLINDGHNRIGDPNNRTNFDFSHLLLIGPDTGTLSNGMKKENREKWESRLLHSESLSTEQLKSALAERLLQVLQ